MIVSYKKIYIKRLQKMSRSVQNQTLERIELFQSDPFHSLLNNHALQGEYLGYRSINITGDIRAIFQELSNGAYEFVEFVDIGSHSRMY